MIVFILISLYFEFFFKKISHDFYILFILVSTNIVDGKVRLLKLDRKLIPGN